MFILVDSNYICHLAKHAMEEFTHEDKKVGVIFGFMRQILSLAKTFKSKEFLFVWDSPHNLRKQIFPEYKLRRVENRSEQDQFYDDLAFKQFNILRTEIIPGLYGEKRNYMFDGFEADDIIARIVQSCFTEDFMVVSSDEDLYQLLDNDRVKMYKIRSKTVYTERSLLEEYECRPKDWASVKAIAGCKSDEIPGVPNVGYKTAVKFLRGNLKVTTKAFADIRKEMSGIIKRNEALVTLPLKGTPFVKVPPFVNPSFDYFLNMSNMYGFASFLYPDAIKKWKETLDMR